MAIAQIISRGYGNGTYSGSIGLVVTRGYLVVVSGVASAAFTAPDYTLAGASTTRYALDGATALRHALAGSATARNSLAGAA